MALEFKTNSTSFAGTGSAQVSSSFGSTVLNAEVALKSFNASYGSGSDADTLYDIVEITNVTYSANTVTYSVYFPFEHDDNHQMSGSVDTLVIAETA